MPAPTHGVSHKGFCSNRQMTTITTFADLLDAARQQSEPQRLLFVFVGASLPEGASAEQRASFEAGESGELAPLMCVDKDPAALGSFEALAAEAAGFEQPWVLVFAAGLAGRGQTAPEAGDVSEALQRMVEAVRSGDLGRFIAFDREGQAVQLG
jgi:hypothetical protein